MSMSMKEFTINDFATKHFTTSDFAIKNFSTKDFASKQIRKKKSYPESSNLIIAFSPATQCSFTQLPK